MGGQIYVHVSPGMDVLESYSVSLDEYMLVALFISVQFSCSVVSDSLQPHESQHARPPCPSPSPGVHSNSPLAELKSDVVWIGHISKTLKDPWE